MEAEQAQRQRQFSLALKKSKKEAKNAKKVADAREAEMNDVEQEFKSV